ncbi:spondin domain-containing protein [Ovoidimarina sediminis]|uniref:spondin domain-containing protein n=1 Tax=Ovoidimarina sediminis TaxID=3079856 RepID=UPI00290BA392|nr:spondin domain-containing protein [Rhodophyticola sp. MJ-SS7]MDU8944014.1 spondin domain-containing protein [Rhodophyticola sp. MJ-SS7]
MPTTPAARVLFALGLCLSLPQAARADTATFKVTIDITWSAETAPFEFPQGGHVTHFIGATHNSRYVLFRNGQTASSGLELVAENGRDRTLEAELAEADRRGRIGGIVEGPALRTVPGQITFRFTVTPEHSLVSFVSMIAPSPDWFTGLADIPLHDGEAWIDAQDHPLWMWDSGTDASQTYATPDADLQPQESVRLVATPHVLTKDGLVPMGTARIVRVTP